MSTLICSTWMVVFWCLLLVGCSSEEQSGVAPIPTIATVIPENTAMVAAANVRDRQVLDIATHTEPVNYDVHRSLSSSLHRSGPGLVYSRLLRFSLDSESASLGSALECDLCTTWEQVDQTTYRFTLREKARWHNIEPLNGRFITVEDVIHSYRRQQTQGWPNAGLLRNLYDIAKIDDSVLEIKTYMPDADFVLSLAAGHSKILPIEVSSLYEDVVSKGPIGTGPWVFLRDSPGGEYVLEANPFYYEVGLPKMDVMRIRVIPDQMVRFASMAVGDLDFVDLTFEQVGILDNRPREFATMTMPHYGSGIEFVLNTDSIPLDSREVRQVIFNALDPWEYSKLYWPEKTFNGLGFPARHESWYMSQEELKEYVGSFQEQGPLSPSVSLSGTGVTLSVGDYGVEFVNLAKEVTSDLASIGMQVEMKIVTVAEYLKMAKGMLSYDMYLGPSIPVVTPNQYFFAVLHSEGRYNSHGYTDAGLDLLIELQGQDMDPMSRTSTVKEINKRGMHSATRLMLVTDHSNWGWDVRMSGVSINSWAQEYFNYTYFFWSDDR